MYIQDILGFDQDLCPVERKDHLSMAQYVKIYYFLQSAIPFYIAGTLFCHKCRRIWYVQHHKDMCIQDMSGFDQGLHPVERNDNFSMAPNVKNYYFLQFPIPFCISETFFSHKCTYIWYVRHHKYMYIQDILGFNRSLRPAERKDRFSMVPDMKN